MNDQPLYLIWSEEHGAWWRSNKFGYTRSVEQAGRYSQSEAIEICRNANQGLPAGVRNELMVLAKWADDPSFRP